MSNQEYKQTVTDAEAGRLDTYVARCLKWSRSRVRGLIAHGGVLVDDAAVTDGGLMLRTGDLVVLRYDAQRQYREAAAVRPTRGFCVVYCDEHLVVVEKDAGLLTVPTDRREANTLVQLLATHLGKGHAKRGAVSVVHRLDRETSGLLVFGRTAAVAASLIAQFAARKPEREYAAIARGTIAKESGEIRSYLQTDRALNQRSAASGELAVSHYEVLTRYKDTTFVRVRLATGRRNQIRVHLSELGHPVIGDQRYEASLAKHAAWPYKRLALHARVLGFQHPVTRQALRFESPLPHEFLRFAKSETIKS